MQMNTARTKIPRRHAARLRHYWRSSGWAHHDNIDIDLLGWGLIEEVVQPTLASRFLLTDSGREALATTLSHNRRARSRHAAITRGVAQHLANAGRLVFTELAIYTVQEQRWRICKPDVFSLAPGLRADHLAPRVHEVKVKRADLLGELRGNKTARYRELAGEIFFVLAPGIAEPDEIPSDYGVVIWYESNGYTPVRPSPRRETMLETRLWMALAKATPFVTDETSPQFAF